MRLEDRIFCRLEMEGVSISDQKRNSSLFFLHYKHFIFNFLPDVDPFFSLKNKILGFGYAGDLTRVRSDFKCSHPENLYFIGSLFVNYRCTFLANAPILIGRNVAIG